MDAATVETIEQAAGSFGRVPEEPPESRFYWGDLLPFGNAREGGVLFAADPTDPESIDALIKARNCPPTRRRKQPLPRTAIIEPPNSRDGYDCLVYLASLGIENIIAWDANRYPTGPASYRKGNWVTWDISEHAEEGDFHQGRMAYVLGADFKRPLIARCDEDPHLNYYNRRSIPAALTAMLLRGVPKYSCVLIAYDPSGNTTAMCRKLCLETLTIDPEPGVIARVAEKIGVRR